MSETAEGTLYFNSPSDFKAAFNVKGREYTFSGTIIPVSGFTPINEDIKSTLSYNSIDQLEGDVGFNGGSTAWRLDNETFIKGAGDGLVDDKMLRHGQGTWTSA
jgi:hypothetical protein